MAEIAKILDQQGPHYLIAYDIAGRNRWRRIHRLCAAHAMAVQYSFFLFSGPQHQLLNLVAQLQAAANPDLDDIRVYRIKQASHWVWIGRPLFPTGVTLL